MVFPTLFSLGSTGLSWLFLYTNESFYVIFCRSLANGNCLYSSISLFLFGNPKSFFNELRLLTCIELYSYPEFYANHEVFSKYCKNKNQLSAALCMSTCAENKETNAVNIVKQEAIIMCREGRFSSFLCLLALASVVK